MKKVPIPFPGVGTFLQKYNEGLGLESNPVIASATTPLLLCTHTADIEPLQLHGDRDSIRT